MVDKPEEKGDIQETDIIFDCPYCSKSLAIDYRGAGLSIPCSDCGQIVPVPIPEGMELNDLDSSEEEQEIRIINLRKSLSIAEEKIAKLNAEIDELTDRRETLEKGRTENMFKLGAIVENVGLINKSMEDITKALDKIVELSKTQN
jgi:transcription elongation factor Elf1